jgi:hypothetical protein
MEWRSKELTVSLVGQSNRTRLCPRPKSVFDCCTLVRLVNLPNIKRPGVKIKAQIVPRTSIISQNGSL